MSIIVKVVMLKSNLFEERPEQQQKASRLIESSRGWGRC